MNMLLSLLNFIYLATGLAFAAAANGNDNDNDNDNDDSISGDDEARVRVRVRVPVIDLAPWFATAVSQSSEHQVLLTEEQRNIVHKIRRACREVGFFQITGHTGGIRIKGGEDEDDDDNNNDNDAMILERTWKASKEFFDLSTEEKLLHKTTDTTKYPYGYERSETLVKGKLLDGENDDVNEAGAGAADLKETFAVGPPTENGSGMPPRRWIDSSPNHTIADFQNSLEAYYQRMEDLALILLQIFAIALDESPDFFENKMDHHMSALRLVHYYPLLESTTKTKSKSKRRLVRAGAHTDYGALTILAAQEEGLEVLLRDNVATDDNDDENENNKQRWYPVPLVPGALVVNLGDLMQRWTNNEWVSTMHRVVMPFTSPEAQERRYSMAYFVNINGDTPIKPLNCCRGRGEDDDGDVRNNSGRVITAGEHLMAKHLASMGITTNDDNKDDDITSSIGEEGEL